MRIKHGVQARLPEECVELGDGHVMQFVARTVHLLRRRIDFLEEELVKKPRGHLLHEFPVSVPEVVARAEARDSGAQEWEDIETHILYPESDHLPVDTQVEDVPSATLEDRQLEQLSHGVFARVHSLLGKHVVQLKVSGAHGLPHVKGLTGVLCE